MSFWGKLGKGLLKVAPIAAAFIPGVGPLASMAISGAANAASKKLSGGSWKDSLLSGGIGAGAGYLGGKIPGLGGAKGLGPSNPSSYATEAVKKVAGESGGWKDKLGGVLANMGTGGSDQDRYGVRTPPFVEEQNGRGGWQSALGGLLGGAIDRYSQNRGQQSNQSQSSQPQSQSQDNLEPQDMGTSRFQRQMRRQLGPVMGQANQNNPNLALSIGQGRMDAMRDQPFRGGYDVRTETDYDEDTGESTYAYTPMPRIGPNYNQPRQDQYYGGGGNPANEGQSEVSGFKRRLGGRRRQEEAPAY
jgi:hypothetical protein